MADDETTETQDTPPEPEADAPVAEEPVAAAEPVADEPVADEPVAEASAASDEAAADAEPEEQLSSKERRRRERSTHREARPSRSAEERHDERGAVRRANNAARTRRRKQEREKAAKSGPREGTPSPEHVPGTPQVRQGIVFSAKGDKTFTVVIDSAKRHPRYQKIVRSTKKLHVHDERNDAREGDTVRVIECRPMSRTKRWRLDEVLERAK
jgi:small subunit ribosomal protein S17